MAECESGAVETVHTVDAPSRMSVVASQESVSKDMGENGEVNEEMTKEVTNEENVERTGFGQILSPEMELWFQKIATIAQFMLSILLVMFQLLSDSNTQINTYIGFWMPPYLIYESIQNFVLIHRSKKLLATYQPLFCFLGILICSIGSWCGYYTLRFANRYRLDIAMLLLTLISLLQLILCGSRFLLSNLQYVKKTYTLSKQRFYFWKNVLDAVHVVFAVLLVIISGTPCDDEAKYTTFQYTTRLVAGILVAISNLVMVIIYYFTWENFTVRCAVSCWFFFCFSTTWSFGIVMAQVLYELHAHVRLQMAIDQSICSLILVILCFLHLLMSIQNTESEETEVDRKHEEERTNSKMLEVCKKAAHFVSNKGKKIGLERIIATICWIGCGMFAVECLTLVLLIKTSYGKQPYSGTGFWVSVVCAIVCFAVSTLVKHTTLKLAQMVFLVLACSTGLLVSLGGLLCSVSMVVILRYRDANGFYVAKTVFDLLASGILTFLYALFVYRCGKKYPNGSNDDETDQEKLVRDIYQSPVLKSTWEFGKAVDEKKFYETCKY